MASPPLLWRSLLRPATPQGHLIRSFVLLILAGTLILAHPCCQAQSVRLLDCFFVATSAVCVTGLITINLAESFNEWGQFVTLLLMQLGGLGIITFAILAFKIVGAQISLASQSALTDAVLQKDAAAEFRTIFYKIIYIILGIEASGAAIIAADRWLVHAEPLPAALWQGAFHAVSAFCNAGFTLWNDSLCSQDWMICTAIMLLIFCGGIGQAALVEIYTLIKNWLWCLPPAARRPFSYNTVVVLVVSFAIIAAGMFTLLLTSMGTGHDLSLFDALFQSVSSRTAGFNCFDQSQLTRTDKLLTILMMFIGGSPGSCAGGIKTTTFAIWIASVVATLRNREEYTFLGRQIPRLIVNRARKLIHFTILWNLFGVFLLSISEKDADILTLLFEQVSAFGTVGLSLNFTPDLSDIGRLWICLSMFVGRMGPLTLALGIQPIHQAKIYHPEGRIMIG